MNNLDLCAGIAGMTLGLERAGFNTIAFCEIDKHARKVLEKNYPEKPIFRDVKKLKYKDGTLFDDKKVLKVQVQTISAGFPCQDISVGGSQTGIGGSRSGLWKEIVRLIDEIGPKYAIIENVERLRKNGLGVVLNDLHKIGYDVEWHCITARAIGLPHQRDRIWIIAYPSRERQDERARQGRHLQANEDGTNKKIHTKRKQCELKSGEICTILSRGAIEDIKDTYSDRFSTVRKIRRVTNGVPAGVDEARRKIEVDQLGNAVVPQMPEMIGKAIMEYENEKR